jgi:hypothetical protein
MATISRKIKTQKLGTFVVLSDKEDKWLKKNDPFNLNILHRPSWINKKHIFLLSKWPTNTLSSVNVVFFEYF